MEANGREAAVKALAAGRPFAGMAAEAERQVAADLEAEGRAELVRRTAVRLQTAADLYWQAVKQAADAGDLKRLDGYVARFGWLAASCLRAWAQVRAEERAKGMSLLGEALRLAEAEAGEGAEDEHGTAAN